MKKIFALGFIFIAMLSGKNIHAQNNSFASEAALLSKKLGISISENSKYLSLYKETVNWLGTRYRMGGNSTKGVDCSAFTGNIYLAVFDKKLDRRSRDIANNVTENVKKEDLKTGDLVFFSTSRRGKGINHVGVYLKNNKFVHASCGKGVTVSSLDEKYYQRTWQKGGRLKNVEPHIIRMQRIDTQIPIPLLKSEEVKIASCIKIVNY